MAQISIVSYSLLQNYLGRIDAEFYKPESLRADEAITRRNYKPLSELVSDGYRVVYENTKILTPDLIKKGIDAQFLQATDISIDGLSIDVENIGYVDQKDWTRYPKGRIKVDEILIEVKGQAEKVTIVQDYVPTRTLVTGTLFKITLKPGIVTHEYLFAFFSSKYGKILRDRTKVNTLIAYVSKPELYRLPIPIFGPEQTSQIGDYVKESFKLTRRATELYKQATDLLEQELGLDKIRFEKPRTFFSSFSDAINGGRISSYFFQPKYNQLNQLLGKYETVPLRKLINYYTTGFAFAKKHLTKERTDSPLVKIANIKLMELDLLSSDFVNEAGKVVGAREKIKLGDILIGMSGSVGTSAVVREEKIAYINQRILRINSLGLIDEEYLALVINSQVGKMQFEKYGTGGVQVNISPRDMLNIKIPRLGKKEYEISDLVKKSFEAKKQSKQLLAQAKSRVEQLIEQSADN